MNGVEAAEVKARISLRALFERDTRVLKKSGANLVCLSPFVQEKTPSCVVHEKEGYFKCFSTGIGGDCFVYWKETRKCDFNTALAELASIAGVGPGLTPSPVVVAPKREEEAEALAAPISGDEAAKWTAAVATFLADEDEQRRMAEWRGYRLETVRWAIERGLMGVLPLHGVRRVAFPVERPEGGRLVQVAYHVRLGPDSPGNPERKASWRFMPSRCGSWPFVVGDVSNASVVFALEGQWDALALIDVMGWEAAWPVGVAVVGMRGATSWKRFLKFCLFAPRATLFCLSQSDEAGQRWFDEGGFAHEAQKKFHRVYGFRTAVEGCKDWNDCLKAGELNGPGWAEVFRRKLRGSGRPGGKKPTGKTFFQWCARQVNDKRDGPVGMAAADVVADKSRPRRRKPLATWERYWERRGVQGELREALRAAWTEWRGGR
ncbi:MAG: CHC2 zinc finger domain-containing protein [Verrucomicrobiia bacterium]